MEVERYRVHDDRNQWSPDPDLHHSGPRPILAGDDGRERDIGGHCRKLHPLLSEATSSLGVDSGRSTECEHEQRTEENQGCEIAVDDEVDQRPERYPPTGTGGG